MQNLAQILCKKIKLSLFALLITASLSAQPDPYPGTWSMNDWKDSSGKELHFQLHIGQAERGLLYPAQLTIHYDSFLAVYNLLLVKKNSRETGISKYKYAVSETPFSLDQATYFINGIFDFNRDLKGRQQLTLNRINPKPIVPDTAHLSVANKASAAVMYRFLKDAEISLHKTESIPWKDENSHILSPSVSAGYFGLLDTIYLPVKDGIVNLAGFKKTDIVTVILNGKPLMEQISINKKKPQPGDILLDTGLNTLVLFAENFGSDLPSQSMMNLQFGNKKLKLDFNNRRDSAASFIVAQLFVDKDKEKEIYFQENTGVPNPPLQKNETQLGSITSVSRKLTFAIWDDAVEDGDSISISINGEWITRGFPVKKIPQFITIELKSGANAIAFKADNLGSIPPNTSVLEIIDGKKRKSYMLETVPGENKVLNIFYDIHPH